jgi:hypothetical protein
VRRLLGDAEVLVAIVTRQYPLNKKKKKTA